MPVKPIPDGYHTATPYYIIRDASAAIEFYKKAFGATEKMRMMDPSGKIMHAEIQIGNSPIMLADEGKGMDGPEKLGGTPISMVLYVENVDKFYQQAVAAGAKVMREVQDQFYGDRMGTLVDPFGHVWSIGTHIEDVSEEEMQKRAEAAMKQRAK